MAPQLFVTIIEEVNIFRQVFDLFDRNKDETMNSRDLMAALKALGQNPSQEETRNLINQVIEICYWTKNQSHT